MIMKKLKLFPKIFLYTFSVMLFIIIIAHIMIYTFAPQMLSSINSISENGIMIENALNTERFVSEAILRAFPFSFILSIIIAFICSFLFSRVITTPIKEISDTTEKMAKLKKEVSCPVYSFDEIGVLATNVNTLYKNLITTINNLEDEKIKSNEAEQLKVDFLRSASHELKTPVTALNAILENMILGVGKYKNKDVYLLECKEIADRLSHMIKEILDTSRLDFLAGSEKTEEFNLAEILNKICEPYQLISQSKGIDFQVTVQDTCLVNTSKKHMEKLLSNVLSNAVSYTELGHSVSVVLQKNKIMVKNECTPIPESIIPHLFEPFYRPDFARNRKDGGNGLGLYIVDMIAKSLNLTYTFKQMNAYKVCVLHCIFRNLSLWEVFLILSEISYCFHIEMLFYSCCNRYYEIRRHFYELYKAWLAIYHQKKRKKFFAILYSFSYCSICFKCVGY